MPRMLTRLPATIRWGLLGSALLVGSLQQALAQNVELKTENPGAYSLMKGAEINAAVRTCIKLESEGQQLQSVSLRVKPAKAVAQVALYKGDKLGEKFNDTPIAKGKPDAKGKVSLKANEKLAAGESYYWLDITPAASAPVGSLITADNVEYTVGGESHKSEESIEQRVGQMVAAIKSPVTPMGSGKARACGLFRILGLVMTKHGKLLGVVVDRYKGG